MIEWVVSSSALIVILVTIRWIFRKRLSMRARYALWLAVALRLLIPVSFFESSLSILNFVGQLTISDGKDENSLYRETGYISQEEQGEVTWLNHGFNQVYGAEEGTEIIAGIGGLELQGVDEISGLELQGVDEISGLKVQDVDGTGDLTQWNGKEIAGPETNGLKQQNGEESVGLKWQSGEEAVDLNLLSHLPLENGLQVSTGNEELVPMPVDHMGFMIRNGERMAGGRWLRFVWMSGMLFFFGLVVAVNFSYWKCVYRSRRRYQWEKGNCIPVYVSTAIRMPCMFGLIHPAVYLAQDVMDEKTLGFVLCHENTHYRHKDNLWTLVRLLCVCVHWFNPLVWLAAYLSKQDCELACDEETIVQLGEENRIDYGRTLLSLSLQDGELFGGLRFSTTMSGRKKQLKERLQVIAERPGKKGASLLIVLLFMPLMVLVTFTGSRTVEAYEENVSDLQEKEGETGFYESDAANLKNGVVNLENRFVNLENGNSHNGLQGGNVINGNSAYASIDLNDERSYALQVISRPAAENGGYEILQVNLCRNDDGAEAVLQSICPGDVKPFYTKPVRGSGAEDGSDGQYFAFRSEGEPVYAKSLYGFEELPAYARGKFLEDGNETQLSFLPDGGILVADLNFDGYEDFCLQIGVESVNQPFYCYLWNPKEECFEHSVMIPNVKVDQEAQLIESATEDGEGQHSVKYYQFDEAGLLHMVRYVEENQSPDAVFPSLDLTYHETSYSLPAVDDWDAGTEYGGALNERYIYWAKEALTELYEWSGTKVDTACFTVTYFGDFYFGNTPQDLDASRDFYARAFGAKAGFYDVIECMRLLTERVVWYSSVVQWKVPEQLKNMTDLQVVEWYFERSALAEGEILETIENSWGDDYVIRAESGNYYEMTLNRASREIQSVYGPYDSYPLH